jgi:hypothetical protein
VPENKANWRSRETLHAARREKNVARKAGMLDYLSALGVENEIAALIRDLPPPAPLPRKVWMYWHDGWDKAPELCRLCLQSWRLRNPGYEVHALDLKSLGDVIAPPVQRDMAFVRGYANRVRLRLLKTHSGVWADATNFCLKPVEPWIHERVARAGLFAYTLPNAERLVATWFLAALPHASLMTAWEFLITRYFEAIEREKRRVHGYFFMPYTLEYALTSEPGLAAQWERMPKVPLGDIGKVGRVANLDAEEGGRPLGEKKLDAIRAVLATAPMQKLTWKGQVRAGTQAAQQVTGILRDNLRT